VAVAKFTWQADSEGQGDADGSLVLEQMGRKEAVYWNELFDNISAISEVFLIDTRDLPGEDIKVGEVVNAGSRLGAGLCVLYSEGCVDRAGRQAVGTVYDAVAGVPLVFAKSELLKCHGVRDDGVDPAENCASDEAAAQFRRLMHRAVWDLSRRSWQATTQPSPWSDWWEQRNRTMFAPRSP
jgi:hypothetical protein